MQEKMQGIQEKLAVKEVAGSAGGGLVKVTVSGKGDLKKVDIANELLAVSEKEVLQDLIVAAFTDAKNKIESDFNDEMAGIADELGLPPGFKIPS
jgi:DNA-binding YbaB/EbfC family protein